MVERSLSMREVTGSTPVSSIFDFVLFHANFTFSQVHDSHQSRGVVAQWTTRLTTDQKIPGSTPGSLDFDIIFIEKTLF